MPKIVFLLVSIAIAALVYVCVKPQIESSFYYSPTQHGQGLYPILSKDGSINHLSEDSINHLSEDSINHLGIQTGDTPRSDLLLSPGSTRKILSEPQGPTWKEKTFCHDFLVNTFHDSIPVCGSEVKREDQVKCRGTVYSNIMSMCSCQNLAVNPQEMRTVIPSDLSWSSPKKNTINLVDSTNVDCKSPSSKRLEAKTEKNDYQLKLTQHLLNSEKVSPRVCDVWMNKTAFFHVSNKPHIYFRFLDLYNVHKALLDYTATEDNHQVVRIGNLSPDYRFPEFDKALFPGAISLDDLLRYNTVCFREVIFVPRSYQSVPFRCKMAQTLKKRCMECNGKGLTGSPFYSFRSRVLKACKISEDQQHHQSNRSHLMIISRKPYQRWTNDRSYNFQRVLKNEDEMVASIRKAFPRVEVKVLHMESLNICEQVRYAVEADVLLGVHGAGLVHFWWLEDMAEGLELEPSFEYGNPSFRMLTKLAGRGYVSERISGSSKSVTVNINHLIQTLRRYL